MPKEGKWPTSKRQSLGRTHGACLLCPQPILTHLSGPVRDDGGLVHGSWWSLASCSWFWPSSWNMVLRPATVPFWIARSEWRRYSSRARWARRLLSSSAALILRTEKRNSMAGLDRQLKLNTGKTETALYTTYLEFHHFLGADYPEHQRLQEAWLI